MHEENNKCLTSFINIAFTIIKVSNKREYEKDLTITQIRNKGKRILGNSCPLRHNVLWDLSLVCDVYISVY